MSSTPATNSTTCDGTITFSVSGPYCIPFTYTLLPGMGPFGFINLCPGTFTLIVSDTPGPGCCGVMSGTVNVLLSTSISEMQHSNFIKIFPNPVSNYLNISIDGKEFENSDIEIINTLGQIVLKVPFSKTIDVSRISMGIYSLKLLSKNSQIHYSRFVKE